MEVKNGTANTESPADPPGTPAAKGGDAAPEVMGGVGEETALSSVVVVGGGKSEVVGSEMMAVKKRRGRPRKHDVNGNLLSPPSALPPPPGFSDYSFGSCGKRSRGRPRGSGKLQLLASIGGVVADTAGGSFTPHVVTVNTGEDVVSKIVSFSQRGPRAVCILSATGAVSSVIIRQPGSSGGLLRFEGRFEIISLTGSYTSSDSGRRKSGMLSVSLANPDGKVFGGGIEGSLIAANPIQLIVGSFKQNISKEIKRRHSAISYVSSDIPKMIEGETSEHVTTTNGLSENAIIPATVPDNVDVAATQNMHSPSSSNGHSMDSQDMHSIADHGLSIDIDISEPRL